MWAGTARHRRRRKRSGFCSRPSIIRGVRRTVRGVFTPSLESRRTLRGQSKPGQAINARAWSKRKFKATRDSQRQLRGFAVALQERRTGSWREATRAFASKSLLSDPLLCLTGSRSNSIKNVDADNWKQEQQDLERTRAAIRRETENLLNEIHDQSFQVSPTLQVYGANSR
jgi:hypothetical protein